MAEAQSTVEKPARRNRRERTHDALELVDDAIHLLVAFGLVILAVVLCVHIAIADFGALLRDFLSAEAEVPNAVLSGVNDVLFVVIILEILRTVTAHLKEHAFALRPFIIIGIISAVRHLLIVGARMSVGEGTSASEHLLFQQHVVELAVNGLLAMLLVFAYWLVTRIRDT